MVHLIIYYYYFEASYWAWGALSLGYVLLLARMATLKFTLVRHVARRNCGFDVKIWLTKICSGRISYAARNKHVPSSLVVDIKLAD